MHSTKFDLRSLLFVAVAALPSSACDLDLVFSGHPTPTTVSGTSTGDVHTLSVDGGRYGVESIEWNEGGVNGGLDRPCFLQVVFRSLNDSINESEPVNIVEKWVNVCNLGSYTDSSHAIARLRFAHESVATGNIDSWHLYAGSVQTCDSTNAGNDRIKGVSLWGRSQLGVSVPEASEYECITEIPNGVVHRPCRDDEVRRAQAEQDNCGAWNSVVACPAGQIASAVKVHVANGNEIVGLGLECDTVVDATAP